MTKTSHLSLSNKEINSYLPISQRPFHYAIQSNVKIDQDKYNDIILVLTKHYIFGLNNGNSSHKKKLNIFEIHISNINQIKKNKDKNVFIGSSQGDISLFIYNLNKNVTKFCQLLYRNITLSYYDSNNIELSWDDNSKFPPIDIRYLSPSQSFQFNYFAYCTQNKKKYNHNFVRYMHNLIIEDSPIIDLSILSPKYFQKRINSLKCAKNIFRGICLKNFAYPDVIKAFSKLLVDSSNIKIVSFSNCNCTKGLTALADVFRKSKKKSFNVAYWDLSYNKFSNFSNFSTIIENSAKPIKYLNINGCDICDEDTKMLFSTLENFQHANKLKFLSIAGAAFDSNKSINAFKKFLKVCSLTYLDLGSISDVADVITALEKVGIKTLKTLILRNTLLETRSLDDLKSIIEYSDNLTELDISGTGLRIESISSIIEAINNNENIKKFSIKLNSLELHGDSLKSIIKSFLNNEVDGDNDKGGHSSPKSKRKSSKMKRSTKKSSLRKWRSLSFASNGMGIDDLNKLIDLFETMERLKMVYLDDNFDFSMVGVGDILCDLLRIDIPLIGISLAGSKKHKLGDEMITFLKDASKSEILEYLNVENNDLGNGSIQTIKNLLINSKSLKTLKIDHNSFSSISKIKSIVDAAEVCQTLTTFGFPLFDSVQICANDDEGNMEEKLVHLQSRANFIMSQHRREKMAESVRQNGTSNDIIYEHLKCQVPFDVENEDVERLLASLINKYPSVLPNKRNYHSFACELFDLPFPFQQENELSSDCKLDILRQENSDYLKVYDKSESLLDYIKELPRQFSYPSKKSKISYLPTYGPTISTILDDDYLKRPKNLQSIDQSDFRRKRKAAVQFPSDIKISGKNNDTNTDYKSGDVPLKTRDVDSRNLDGLVDTRLNEDENPKKPKRKGNNFGNSQKKKRMYDNEALKKSEEELPKSMPLFDGTSKSIFDESSDDENSVNNQKNKRQQKPTPSRSKLKIRAEDNSYSNSDEEDDEDEIVNHPRQGQRIRQIRNNQDYSSDPPNRNERRRRILPNMSDDDDDNIENIRQNRRKLINNRNQINQNKNNVSDSSSTSEDDEDDTNTPFMQQRPISKVIPVSTDSYIINRSRNKNNDDYDDDDDDMYDNLHRKGYKRNRKSSAAYDSSNSTDNSFDNSDDYVNNYEQKQRQQPKYNDIDIFNVSAMPKPPHLKSPQDALAFAYDLMIADQSEEQNNNDDDDSDI